MDTSDAPDAGGLCWGSDQRPDLHLLHQLGNLHAANCTATPAHGYAQYSSIGKKDIPDAMHRYIAVGPSRSSWFPAACSEQSNAAAARSCIAVLPPGRVSGQSWYCARTGGFGERAASPFASVEMLFSIKNLNTRQRKLNVRRDTLKTRESLIRSLL